MGEAAHSIVKLGTGRADLLFPVDCPWSGSHVQGCELMSEHSRRGMTLCQSTRSWH
jgi:hypothetical protein